MKKKILLLLALIMCGVLCLAVLLLSSGLFRIPAEMVSARNWRGYYTLVLKSETGQRPEESFDWQRLAALECIEAVVSTSTSPVDINTFDGFESVAIAQLGQRLERRDPRFDPYLQSLPRYFNLPRDGGRMGPEAQSVYLQSRVNSLLLSLRLLHSKLLNGRNWRILEFDPVEIVIRLCLFIAFSAVLLSCRRAGGFNWVLLGGLLPWSMRILLGDLDDVLTFFLIYPLMVHILELAFLDLRERARGLARPFERPMLRRALYLGLLFMTLHLFVLIIDPAAYAKTFIVLGANLLLVPLIFFMFLVVKGFQEHVLFIPVKILGRSQPREKRLRTISTLALLLTVLVSVPLLMFEKKQLGMTTLVPQPIAERTFSWKSLQDLAFLDNQSGIPTLADYLTHRAFQEGIAFARPYRLPLSGERLYLSRYHNDGQKIVQSYRVVKRYQPAWLSETLQGVQPGSVAGLLVDQLRPVRVVAEHELRTFMKRLSWVKLMVVLIFFMTYFVVGDFYLTPVLLYGTRNLVGRRIKQAT